MPESFPNRHLLQDLSAVWLDMCQTLDSLPGATQAFETQKPSAPCAVIALGKCAPVMASWAWRSWGDIVTQLLCVGVDGSDWSVSLPSWTQCLKGDHPLPGKRSIEAGEALLTLARDLKAQDIPTWVLLSGGASACCEAPRTGLSLEILREKTRALLASGVSILELNAARAELSRIKGGGLAQVLGHALKGVAILSDIPGHDARWVGSSPCHALPHKDSSNLDTHVIADPDALIGLASSALENKGWGPVESVGARHWPLAELVQRMVAHLHSGQGIWLTAGEAGISLPPGTLERESGGRARQVALEVLAQAPEHGSWGLLCTATDGRDGFGGSGVIVTSDEARSLDQSEILRALQHHESDPFFERHGLNLTETPARSNLTDLYTVIRLR
jgi:glycerate 2-kinase